MWDALEDTRFRKAGCGINGGATFKENYSRQVSYTDGIRAKKDGMKYPAGNFDKWTAEDRKTSGDI
jgi:hypothetical protein